MSVNRRAPDIERGRQLAANLGCGSCHTISGVRGATGAVGPPLSHLSERTWIAGILPNRADQLEQWILHPQLLKPGVVMPELAMSAADAGDIAAFLLSRR